MPVPDEDLPVLLPDTVDYEGSGENPLTRDEAFLNVTCPRCGGPARRETDTMDTFVDSSWYWYRYLSPHKADAPFDRATWSRRWTPGRAVHRRRRARRDAPAVRPLLHQGDARPRARSSEHEPFKRLFNQGQILGADGERMSKSRGNIQDPDDLVARYGADTIRLFLMFMGPWDQGGPWSPTGTRGRAPLPEPGLDDRRWTRMVARPVTPSRGRLPAGQTEVEAAGSAAFGGPSTRCAT